MSNIADLYTDSFDEGFCGCNSYTGEKCMGHEKTASYTEESYTGKFPMTVGTRGDHVVALQKFLVNKLVLVMGSTAYGYFGPATQRGLVSLGLPTTIKSESELDDILQDNAPMTQIAQPQRPSGGGMSKWKDFAKDPNQVMGLLGKIGLGKKKQAPDTTNNQPAMPNMPTGVQVDMGSNNPNPQPTGTKVPPAVWVVGGLVLLVVIVFVMMKVLKD